jgi:amidase
MALEYSPDVPSFRPSTEGIKAYELWQLQKKKSEIRKKHLDHWNATKTLTGTGRPVDAIIAPMAAYAAPPHGKNKSVPCQILFIQFSLTAKYRSANYTMAWNGLDCSACVFPVTKVSPNLDPKQERHEFLNDVDKATYELCKRQELG